MNRATKPVTTPRDKPRKPAKISRARRPDDMTVSEWQIALRRQYGREAAFHLKNIGEEPVFSDFLVTNPESQTAYRIAIRGRPPGNCFCSCPDFAVNALRTCKHIEFAIGTLERKRGVVSALTRGYQPPYSEVYLHYGVKREVMFKPAFTCPQELKTIAGRYFDRQGLLLPNAFEKFHHFVKAAAHGSHDVRIYEDAITFIAHIRDKATLARRVDEMFSDGGLNGAFKKLVKVPLYSYQRQGALFAAKAGRCLIADDMGLGKTIQAIAAAEILAQVGGAERVLIVTPTSLKHQWKEEIQRFTNRQANIVEGYVTTRAAEYRRPSFFKIVNYDVVHRDLDRIVEWGPDLVILDEAQRIKNWKTRTAQSIKQLPSQWAMVLTGTPLENRIEELHSIVEFVDRFHLGPRFHFLSEHQHVDENGRVIGYRNLSHVAKTLAPILLRRTKDDVLKELPKRLEKRLFLPMTEEQWQHHDENRETVTRLVHKWRRFKFLSEQDQRFLMIALQNMRMVCNSTFLLDQKTDCGVKSTEFMALLEDLLEQPDAKVVVFSQWLRTHTLLAERLKSKRQDFVLFHGGISGQARHALVRSFKEDSRCRIFLSTDVGGTGLNLQNATAVIIMDQPWNPAVLEQRIGRVHRLGQHRPVQVYHFISEHTIEHGMLDLLAFKKSLFAGVLDGGQDEVFLGGTRLKKFMESVERVTGAMPAKPEGSGLDAANMGKTAMDGDTASDDKKAAGRDAEAEDKEVWADLLATGRSLLDGLEQALVGGGAGSDQREGQAGKGWMQIEKDEKTGKAYLKLPLPSPDALKKVALLLTNLVNRTG